MGVTMKTVVISVAIFAALVGCASAFSSFQQKSFSTALFNGNLGAGGMADTRDPNAFQDEDPRKSISAAPSFEEYLKMRDGGGAAPAAAVAAPVAAATPVAYTAAPPATAAGGGGGDIMGTLQV